MYGVDFSGARLAGLNAWVARLDVAGRCITALDRLADLAGDAGRDAALAWLVAAVRSSDAAVWGMDFPFALPIEIVDDRAGWPDQLRWLAQEPDDAYAFGRSCVRRALERGHGMHVRRQTDRETKTPFDCYHYRIICQTFYGMRQVLAPLQDDAATAVVPFECVGPRTRRVVVEACPGSTLKRWAAPHNNYKQPQGGPLTAKRRANRRLIFSAIATRVELPPPFVRRAQRNAGGDAIDAVLAAIGTWESWTNSDVPALCRHERYGREGRIFA